MELWQRTFFVPAVSEQALPERQQMLHVGKSQLSGSQRQLLRTMGWSMRGLKEPTRAPREPSAPMPPLAEEMRAAAQQAVVVAGGMHGVHVDGIDDALLRRMCSGRLRALEGIACLFGEEGSQLPTHRATTPETRASALAYLHAFAEHKDGKPTASLPLQYYLTFFRPLAVAFVAAGLSGLWAAQSYLSCCEGAHHAAFVAFYTPVYLRLFTTRSALRTGVRQAQEAGGEPHAPTPPRGGVERLRPLRPKAQAVEPQVTSFHLEPSLPIDLNFGGR